MQAPTIEQKMFTKTQPAGFVYISKDMEIPQDLKDVNLIPFDKGPINTMVEKPFRIWKSPVSVYAHKTTKDATLLAYQKLLFEVIRSVGQAKGDFVLYVEVRSLRQETELVGGVYKLATRRS